MSDLVQIQNVPPLRQSTEQVMSCPTFYVESFIKGRKQPGGMESARGTQVHRVLAQYASWCASKSIAQDFAAFDRFAKGVGPQAERILAGLRESYSVDHAHLLATELPMSLDEHFQPTDTAGSIEEFCGDSGLPAFYEGTMDAVYLFHDDKRIDIDDAKSHLKPFDPDTTLQGRMYSLFCFQHFPWVEQVKFRLVFVRYKNLSRQVIYTRKDVPMLIDVVKAARARQEMIHAEFKAGRDIEVISGSHCCYCPLLTNRSCPIGEYNDQMQLTPVDWLKWELWNTAFSRANRARMKARIDATGRKITLKDYNGKAYVYGPQETESKVYPLFEATEDGIVIDKDGNPSMPIVSLLMQWANMEENADDLAWMGKLVISSTKLESYLKTKGRVHIHQAVTDTAEKITKVKLKVSKPLDAEDVEDDFDEDALEEEEF